jgi:hypothetical protein
MIRLQSCVCPCHAGAARGFQAHHEYPLASTHGRGLYRMICDTQRIQLITGRGLSLAHTRPRISLISAVLKPLYPLYILVYH